MGHAHEKRVLSGSILKRLTAVFQGRPAPSYAAGITLFFRSQSGGNARWQDEDAAIGYESSCIALFPGGNMQTRSGKDFDRKGG